MGLASSNIGPEPSELHCGVLERLSRARIDLLLELHHLLVEPIDLLAGRGPGHGGRQARAGPMGLFQLEQAGFKPLFEDRERGGGHGRRWWSRLRPVSTSLCPDRRNIGVFNDAQRGCSRSNALRFVGRRQVPIMLFNHAGIGMAQVLSDYL